jgi:hypothetical protein
MIETYLRGRALGHGRSREGRSLGVRIGLVLALLCATGQPTILADRVLDDLSKPILQFSEDLRIPSSDKNGRYSFFASGLAADSKGNIYVLDAYGDRVLKFDKAGNYLSSFGRKGQGPGEFQAPVQILVDGQDRVYVKDIVRMSLAVFDENGRFFKNIYGPGIILRFSQIALDSYSRIICGYQPLPAFDAKLTYKIVRFDADFKPLRTLYEKPGVFIWREIKSQRVTAPEYTPEVLWTLGPEDRLCVCYNDSYEIRILSDDGVLLKRIKREYHPEKVAAEEKRRIQEEYKRFGDAAKAIEIPAVKPPITRLYFVGDFLFAYRRRTGRVRHFDVFDKDGEFAGEQVLDFPPLVCKNGFVYTIDFDGDIDNRDITNTAVVRYGVGTADNHFHAHSAR